MRFQDLPEDIRNRAMGMLHDLLTNPLTRDKKGCDLADMVINAVSSLINCDFDASITNHENASGSDDVNSNGVAVNSGSLVKFPEVDSELTICSRGGTAPSDADAFALRLAGAIAPECNHCGSVKMSVTAVEDGEGGMRITLIRFCKACAHRQLIVPQGEIQRHVYRSLFF